MNHGIIPSAQVLKDHADKTHGLQYFYVEPGIINFTYGLSDKTTFSESLSREFRGMLYDEVNNKVIVRPFHKFFNMNEREETRFENLPWGELRNISVKLDGTCISASMYNGRIFYKTKNTISGPLIDEARALIEANPIFMKFLKLGENRSTLIFERLYTKHDENSDVITFYEKDEVKLLAIRDNLTGEYENLEKYFMHEDIIHTIREIDWCENQALTQSNGPVSNKAVDIAFSEDPLKEAKKVIEDLSKVTHEGFIFVFGDRMVKFKTETYLNQVSILNNINSREIARLYIEDKLDDVASYLDMRFDGKYTDKIRNIADDVVQYLETIDHVIRTFDTQGKVNKELFDHLKDHPYSKQIMDRSRGKYTADKEQLKRLFVKHYLPNFPNTPWNK